MWVMDYTEKNMYVDCEELIVLILFSCVPNSLIFNIINNIIFITALNIILSKPCVKQRKIMNRHCCCEL